MVFQTLFCVSFYLIFEFGKINDNFLHDGISHTHPGTIKWILNLKQAFCEI